MDVFKLCGETIGECNSRQLLLVSPDYGNEEYRCNIIADASKLLLWAEKHAQAVYSGDSDEQKAREMLPLWLAAGNKHDESVGKIHRLFNAVILPYCLDLLELGFAQIYCLDCQAFEPNPAFIDEELETEPRFNVSWHSEWRCSKGHLLYYAEHSLRF